MVRKNFERVQFDILKVWSNLGCVATFGGEELFHKDREAFSLKQFHVNSTGAITICPLMIRGQIPDAVSYLIFS